MTPTVKLILILFGLAYLISPVDIIPDLLLPWVGWLDDGLVLWCVYHLIRHGELPWFLFKRPGKPAPVKGRPADPGKKTTRRRTARNTEQAKSGTTKKADHKRTADERQEKKNSRNRDTSKGATSESAYQILGVDSNASWEDIQMAYKDKIKQYHPDKLSHLGEEFSSLANEKFLEIQAAYNRLKAIRKKS